MQHRIKTPVTAALACITLGGALVLYLVHRAVHRTSRLASDTPAASNPVGERAFAPKSDLEKLAMSVKLAELEQRLSAVETASSATAPASTNVERRAPEAPDEQEQAAGPSSEELLDRWSSDFAHDPYDPVWAQVAERSLAPEFQSMAQESGFQLRKLECKSSRCVAIMEFSNYQAATNSAQNLAVHAYPVNCGTSVTMPKPDDDNKPYQVTLFLKNCLRAEPSGSAS